MSATSLATVVGRSLQSRCAQARMLSTSRIRALPRQGLPRPPPLPMASTSATPVESLYRDVAEPSVLKDSNATSTAASSDLPWFLQDEEDVEIMRPTETNTSHSWSPGLSLPQPLSSLHAVLTEGETSGLIARPEEEGGVDSVTGKRPIVYIHAKEKNEDAWTDWIVIVQVKSNAGGSVSRVAREVGTFLKHVRPPVPPPEALILEDVKANSNATDEQRQVTSIEDFLGKEQPTSTTRHKKSKEEESKELENSDETNQIERRPWKPFKIISREAQDGIRLLHSSDPERWSRKTLAGTFKISPESVRRILRAKWRPSAQVVGRQNRRAMERELERRGEQSWMKEEQEEVAMIRRDMERDNQGVDEDEQEYRLQGDGEEDDDEDMYTHPVFYEGLVHSGEDRSKGRGKSAVTRGDGEWCLVDAGWCVVHVMTARARSTYDVESIAGGGARITDIDDSLEASVA